MRDWSLRAAVCVAVMAGAGVRATEPVPAPAPAPGYVQLDRSRCVPLSCDGVPPPTSRQACVTTTSPVPQYNRNLEFEQQIQRNFRSHNERIRARYAGMGLSDDMLPLWPEPVSVQTAFVPTRWGTSATDGSRIAVETHVVHFLQDARGRIFSIQTEPRRPAARSNPAGLRAFWDPGLGYMEGREDDDVILGSDQFPGKNAHDRSLGFNALLDFYLNRVSGCGFARTHARERAYERDPALAAVDAFFTPCDPSGAPTVCTDSVRERLEHNPMGIAPASTLEPVVDALENGGDPPNEDRRITNQRFNLELIHSVRMGLINRQAEILTSVSDDPWFKDFTLGHNSVGWSRGSAARGMNGTQPECDIDVPGARFAFNDQYERAARDHEREIRSTDPAQARLRQRLAERADHRLLAQSLEYAYWQCWFDTSPTGAVTAEAREEMNRLKRENPELALMGHGNVIAVARAARQGLERLAPGRFSFAAFSTAERHCRAPEARDEIAALLQSVAALDPAGPEMRALRSPDREEMRGFLRATRTARTAALNRLRTGLESTTRQCRSADIEWDPTSIPGWLGGDDEGVPLWRDRTLVEDVVRRYAAASPPRLRDLERFKGVLCQNRARQEDADDTKFWVEVGTGVGMVVLTVATFGAGSSVGFVGLAARGVVLADVSMGVAQAVDMVDQAQAHAAQTRILWDAGFSTPEAAQAAEDALTESYFMAGVTAGLSVVFGIGDFRQLASAGLVRRTAERVEARAGTEAIDRALRTEARHPPREVLERALLLCREGDCPAGHGVLDLWARYGADAGAEGALRGFREAEWSALERLDAGLARLDGQIDSALRGGRLPEYETLMAKARRIRQQLGEFLESGGRACAH